MPGCLGAEVIHDWVSLNPFATDRTTEGPSITVITTLQFFQLALVFRHIGVSQPIDLVDQSPVLRLSRRSTL